jgi:hypothetical protein
MDRRPWKALLLRGSILATGAALLVGIAGLTKGARAADDAVPPDAKFVARHMGSLSDQLDDARGEIAMLNLQLERATAITTQSTRHQIPADLAAAIYDIALSEGIDPRLGFQLVKIESNFKANARSPMNAIGYTQLRIPTANFYQPGITERQLFNRETNLRIGFRFLNDLLAKFDQDVHLALLAYNRGPARVEQIIASGGDPKNGYSTAVLKGYHPTPQEHQPVVEP